ncbi:MAG: hypothetical protein WA970_15870 [Gammaproteobacteria bacterium]
MLDYFLFEYQAVERSLEAGMRVRFSGTAIPMLAEMVAPYSQPFVAAPTF